MGELAALGIEMPGSSIKPTGKIEVQYMAVDQHAAVRLEQPLGQRAVIDDSANRSRPHWTQA
jgi:hypothetical protein